jgi:hypothetical protein
LGCAKRARPVVSRAKSPARKIEFREPIQPTNQQSRSGSKNICAAENRKS